MIILKQTYFFAVVYSHIIKSFGSVIRLGSPFFPVMKYSLASVSWKRIKKASFILVHFSLMEFLSGSVTLIILSL